MTGQVNYQNANEALYKYEIRNGADPDLKDFAKQTCRKLKTTCRRIKPSRWDAVASLDLAVSIGLRAKSPSPLHLGGPPCARPNPRRTAMPLVTPLNARLQDLARTLNSASDAEFADIGATRRGLF